MTIILSSTKMETFSVQFSRGGSRKYDNLEGTKRYRDTASWISCRIQIHAPWGCKEVVVTNVIVNICTGNNPGRFLIKNTDGHWVHFSLLQINAGKVRALLNTGVTPCKRKSTSLDVGVAVNLDAEDVALDSDSESVNSDQPGQQRDDQARMACRGTTQVWWWLIRCKQISVQYNEAECPIKIYYIWRMNRRFSSGVLLRLFML